MQDDWGRKKVKEEGKTNERGKKTRKKSSGFLKNVRQNQRGLCKIPSCGKMEFPNGGPCCWGEPHSCEKIRKGKE